jgi:leucine dehydrogenase
MRAYPDAAAALADAMRLAEGMTEKWAILDLPYGGGKTVIAPDRPLAGAAREALLLRYGGLLEMLHGGFQTGEDLGTTPADMGVVARASRHVHGIGPDGSTLDPGPYTARGVLRSIEAALEAALGDAALRDRSVLVQGVGDVGAPLARLLAEAGARVLVSDVDEARAARVAGALGAETVPAGLALMTTCDVYAPCAVGGTLSRESVASLPCRIVAGSANAQLASPDAAERLHERGILYVPDFVANGGGAAAFGLMARGDAQPAMWAKVEGIGDTVRAILAESIRDGEPPLTAARRIVCDRLAAARAAPQAE